MKLNLKNKTSLFVIITLVIVLAGMALFGFLGFNKSVDNAVTYEISVSVDQNVSGSTETAKNSAIEYFANNGIKIEEYSTQFNSSKGEADVQNTRYIFKTFTNVNDIEEGLTAHVKTALNNEKRVVTVEVYEITGYSNMNVVSILVGIAIALVVFFIYQLIADKWQIALTNLICALCSGVLFISIISLARIPAIPFVSITLAVAVILASIFSAVLLNRIKETYKIAGNEKLSAKEISNLALKNSITRLIFMASAIVVSAISLACFGGYSLFIGLQVLVAGASAIYSAFLGAPAIYSLLKK